MSKAEPTSVPLEYSIEVLCRSELGKALWQAAQLGALAEIQHARITELEKQKAPAATEPGSGDA